jgi:peptidyl-prolyl cis-trans isomerase C
MIDRRLLLLEAARKGVRASTTAVDRELREIKRMLPDKDFERRLIDTYQTERDLERAVEERLTTALLLKRETLGGLKVSEDEAHRLWESMPEGEKVHSARVHAAQIVLRTEEDGKAVLEALKKGGDFADLARQKSFAPESVRGGDVGWFESGVMPSVFDEICFSLKPGEISELTPSEYGFHIFKLLEAEEERSMTYEEARPQLFERLREERVRTAEAEYLESLRSRVRIVRNEDLIASIE